MTANSERPIQKFPTCPYKIGLLFPGQGAQEVGMGKSLVENSAGAASVFQEADRILNRSLQKIAFEGPLEELTLTHNCQPALFVHGLAALEALKEKVGNFEITAAAGLSLGEFTAYAAAGTFDFKTGLKLVEKRGAFMEEACAASAGSMAALIGAEENVVRQLAADTDVDIANLNCPGQIVISGGTEKIALAVELARERGIRRATMLNVAGAYHSRLMDSAYFKLRDELETTEVSPPNFPVVSNVYAKPVEPFSDTELKKSLVEQVTGSVRWTQSIEYMIDVLKCDLFLELGPGEVLSGLVRRIRKGSEIYAIGTSENLNSAVERLLAVPATP